MRILRILFLIITLTMQTYVIPANQKQTLYLKWVKECDSGLQSNFLQQLVQFTNAKIFIETGTYKGDTTNRAIPFFEQIYTIELSEELYNLANKRFKNIDKVKTHLGNSSEVLDKILSDIHEKIIFWLDGHYSGFGTGQGKNNTPILQELKIIKKHNIKNAVILIDDIRCFQKNIPNIPINEPFFGYPSINELYKHILAINPDYLFKIFGDIGIAYLANENFTTSALIDACTISRLGNREQKIIHDAEKVIGKIQNQELYIIRDLVRRFRGSEKHGLCGHYRLWNGLTYFYRNQFKRAKQEFNQAIALGLDYARAAEYLNITKKVG